RADRRARLRSTPRRGVSRDGGGHAVRSHRSGAWSDRAHRRRPAGAGRSHLPMVRAVQPGGTKLRLLDLCPVQGGAQRQWRLLQHQPDVQRSFTRTDSAAGRPAAAIVGRPPVPPYELFREEQPPPSRRVNLSTDRADAILASGRIRRARGMNATDKTEIAILEDSQLDGVTGGSLAAIPAPTSGSPPGLWDLLTDNGHKGPHQRLT